MSRLGLSLEHDRRDMIQAVLEGVALRGAELVRAINEVVPARGPLSVDGGLAHNRYFVQMLATALGREVRIAQNIELTAAGALELCCGELAVKDGDARLVAPVQGPQKEWRELFAKAISVSRSWQRK